MTAPEITYISTRGEAPELGFEDVLLKGLADDGGLYVPKKLPSFNTDDFVRFANMPYVAVAFEVIYKFVGHFMPEQDLRDMLAESYVTFDHKDIAPLINMSDDFWIMEQFHGPTLAFKDFALQFLGRIFDYVLTRQNKKITIVGATSGDTGSAAIAGCRGRDNMDIFILYPHGRVSDVQRKQMTSVSDANVHNIAVKGSFDDCQDMVKAMFADTQFREQINMSAVNSINWARIMAQIVYYIYASSRFKGTGSFFVPTGNFGNIYAGYLARQMGAPIDYLCVATNRNDILYRFFETGEMKIEGVAPSLSPSMDIQVSSNFERLMFDLYNRDSARIQNDMTDFRANGHFKMDTKDFNELKSTFTAYRCDDDATRHVMKDTFENYGYIADPHTVTGISAVQQFKLDHPEYAGAYVAMATADPAKFPDAVKGVIGQNPIVPPRLNSVLSAPEHYDILDHDLNTVKAYILDKKTV